ncbi:WD40-repeat-containing domain protein [Lipomyces kononenkoae]|uniref:WD40-repeat-containing domain protein n=1 Tax=Lipomyces kononenkoae TaxID=34357 RepID=A0ACC3T7X4_LIPKO
MTSTQHTAGDSSPWESKTFGTSLSLHLERPVGAMSISPSGRDVVLASRSGLYVVDLDDPYCPPRFLRHTTLWEVADVQWSPHAAKYTWVISTSNQKAMVWNMALPSRNAIEHVLHAHTRAITDINFHAHDPERLATCAVDAFVHCWDMRTPSKPVQSFCDWRAGATQVKWNRQNPHVIASSHDRYVHIWDDRMGAQPLRSISAHSTKIYGVDFDRVAETSLITCSLDKTIKFWDYSNEKDEPVRVITTDFPVWKARHTPFGDGCCIMPQRGGKNGLYIVYNKSEQVTEPMKPVAKFIGHTEPIKEFLWRTRGGDQGIDNREFQLVTWSKDHDLRLWSIDDSILEGVHHVKNEALKYRLTRRGTPYVSFIEEPEAESDSGSQIFSVGIHQPISRESPSFPARNLQTYMTRGGIYDKISHLNWLSGVRIGRSAFARPPDETAPNTEREGVPENLGEEVSIVGNKFPKITFEKIHVSSGEIVVCLNGPWGPDNGIIFIRVEARFPPEYPRRKAPKISVEQNKDLSPEEISKIEAQVQTIATEFTNRRRYCLESCLRYLMGEKDVLDDLEAGEDEDGLPATSGPDLPALEVDEGESSSDDEIIMSPPKST